MTTRTRLHLTALTVAFVCAGIGFALGTPVFAPPDELAHVDMVRHQIDDPGDIPDARLRIREGSYAAARQIGILEAGPLPWPPPGQIRPRPEYQPFDAAPRAGDAATGCVTTCQNYHYAHPPTYYLVAAPVAAAFEDRAFPVEVLALRILSVLVVASAVPLTAVAAARVWPTSPHRALIAATVVATFAPFIAAVATVNNDAAALVLAASAIAAVAAALRRPTVRTTLLLGLAAGAGLLIKATFIPLAFVALVGGVIAVGRIERAQRLRAGLALVLPMAAGGVFWGRSLVRFGGLQPPGTEILQPPRDGPWQEVGPLAYAVDHGGDLIDRFWGVYGAGAVVTPRPWRIGLTLVALGLVAAWLIARRWARPGAETVTAGVLALAPLLLAAAALAASYEVFHTTGEPRGLAGRYLYPALPVLALGFAAAVGTVAEFLDRTRVALVTVTTLTGGLLVAAAIFVAHGYYGTSALDVLLERAHTVTPLPSSATTRWLLGLAIAWAAAMAVAVWAAVSRPSDGPVDRPAPA